MGHRCSGSGREGGGRAGGAGGHFTPNCWKRPRQWARPHLPIAQMGNTEAWALSPSQWEATEVEKPLHAALLGWEVQNWGALEMDSAVLGGHAGTVGGMGMEGASCSFGSRDGGNGLTCRLLGLPPHRPQIPVRPTPGLPAETWNAAASPSILESPNFPVLSPQPREGHLTLGPQVGACGHTRLSDCGSPALLDPPGLGSLGLCDPRSWGAQNPDTCDSLLPEISDSRGSLSPVSLEPSLPT